MIKSQSYGARRRNVTILTSTVDAGGTPTTKLRPKLLMAKLDATGKFGVYDATNNLGLQIPVGVLENETNMILGGAGDKVASILEGGVWTETEILGIDAAAREMLMLKGFEFRDAANNNIAPPQLTPLPHRGMYTVGGDTTLTAAQNGQFFLATAAADFTLPAIAIGLEFFLAQKANANLGVAGSANILAKGNAAANLVRFSTAGQLIGSLCAVRAVYDGAALKWMFINLCGHTTTVT